MTAPPVKVRLRLFWEAARAARGRAPDDELQPAFVERARTSGLIAALDAVTHRHGQETVEHVLRWALRDKNPWSRGEFPDD
jgi:hypothetical protein